MNIKDFVIAIVLVLVLAGSICYIIKAKKSGAKCIGCPSSKECNDGNCNGHCSCGCHSSDNE